MDRGIKAEGYNHTGSDQTHEFDICKTWHPGNCRDNGPQFSAELYATFAKDYGFKHVTSSPYYPQGNGEAERAMKTIKGLLRKSGDPYLSLLAYRSTPLENGYSPA